MGSGSLFSAAAPSPAKVEWPPRANKGLPARNRKKRRRLGDGAIHAMTSLHTPNSDAPRPLQEPSAPARLNHGLLLCWSFDWRQSHQMSDHSISTAADLKNASRSRGS